jgi:integration host factor subunit alpha
MSSVTKNLIAQEIYSQMGIPVSMAENIVNDLFDLVVAHVEMDKIAKIANFGSFNLRQKKPRVGRDLNTKQDVIIAARNVVSFCASVKLKEMVNGEKTS